MPRLSALLTGMVVLIVSGLVHGLWTDRWGWSAEPEASAAKVAALSTTVGDWDMVHERSLDPNELADAGVVSYVVRTYRHRETRSQVEILLLCGRPGHISVHTPDICFQGAGYEFSGSPSRKADTGQPGNDFWTADCAKQTGALPENYRLYWSWNAEGRWQAPDNPRLTFARHKALFKLYVIEKTPSTHGSSEKDPAVDFLGQLLPELKKRLFPES